MSSLHRDSVTCLRSDDWCVGRAGLPAGQPSSRAQALNHNAIVAPQADSGGLNECASDGHIKMDRHMRCQQSGVHHSPVKAGCCVGHPLYLVITLGALRMPEDPSEMQPIFSAGCCSIYLRCNETCFPSRGWLLVFIEHLTAEELQKQ